MINYLSSWLTFSLTYPDEGTDYGQLMVWIIIGLMVFCGLVICFIWYTRIGFSRHKKKQAQDIMDAKDEIKKQAENNGHNPTQNHVIATKGQEFDPHQNALPILLTKISELNPSFMTKMINKTNLAPNKRVDKNGNPISITQALEFYPEEKVRLNAYYLLLKKFKAMDIDLEFPIKEGSKTKFADIVVFMPNSAHTQNNILYLFECKKLKASKFRGEDMSQILKEGEQQLQTYMLQCANVIKNGLGCLTNGQTTKFYQYSHAENGQLASFKIVPNPDWFEFIGGLI